MNKLNITSSTVILSILLLIILYSLYDTKCLLSLCIIRFLHIMFIIFIIFGPFLFKTREELMFYIIVSTFMMLHWIIANDMCALTLAEQYITGRKSDDTFIGQIVKPIYNITNKQITMISVLLLLVAVGKYTCLVINK